MNALRLILDILVPMGPFLRRVEKSEPFDQLHYLWPALLVTYLLYWLFSVIPFYGSFIYLFVMTLGSAWLHNKVHTKTKQSEKLATYLWYLLVMIGGFASLQLFIGHFFAPDLMAKSLGWAMGSPFQLVLAFAYLAIALVSFLTIWYKEQAWLSAGLLLTITLYGTGYVLLKELSHDNLFLINTVLPVILNYLVIPTAILWLLNQHLAAKKN
jgi:hypothetical protein